MVSSKSGVRKELKHQMILSWKGLTDQLSPTISFNRRPRTPRGKRCEFTQLVEDDQDPEPSPPPTIEPSAPSTTPPETEAGEARGREKKEETFCSGTSAPRRR